MNITLLTYDSRGDVQPFLALAVGLQKAGHQVKLAAPHRYVFPIFDQVVRRAFAACDDADLIVHSFLSRVPNLVVLFAADQFFGIRVCVFDVGLHPFPVKKLPMDKLITALADADGEPFEKARRLWAERSVRKMGFKV
jgi:hypothetical protein